MLQPRTFKNASDLRLRQTQRTISLVTESPHSSPIIRIDEHTGKRSDCRFAAAQLVGGLQIDKRDFAPSQGIEKYAA